MEIIILLIVAFITSSISAVIGMGGGVILLGIMAIIIPQGFMVVALHGIIQLTSNITRAYVFKKYIDIKIVKQFFIGALLGLFCSSIIIIMLVQFFSVSSANEIKVDFLKPLIGIFIIWYLFLKGPKKPKGNQTFFLVGSLSGISTVFIGATGPLIAPFFFKKKLIKESIIANKAICQAITHIGKIPLFIYFFNVDYISEINILLPLMIAVFIGTNIGKKVLNFIPENIFRILFKGVLFIISIKLIIFN